LRAKAFAREAVRGKAMQYVSTLECSEWLRQNNIVEAPYSSKSHAGYYKQYHAPEKLSFAEPFVEKIVDSKSALLVFTDWIFYPPDEWQYYKSHQVSLVEAVKDAATKFPDFEKGLGFIYEPLAHAKLVSHIRGVIELGWTAYLYSETATATVLFWEGDLIDIWSESKAALKDIGKMLR
jgi:hypothetical protein